MVIFHGYVSLPEGSMMIVWWFAGMMVEMEHTSHTGFLHDLLIEYGDFEHSYVIVCWLSRAMSRL